MTSREYYLFRSVVLIATNLGTNSQNSHSPLLDFASNIYHPKSDI